MLKTAKSNMVKTKNFSSTTLLLSIREGGVKRKTLNCQLKGKGKVTTTNFEPTFKKGKRSK